MNSNRHHLNQREMNRYPVAFAILLLVLVQTSLFINNHNLINKGVLPFDGDGYWHLLRAEMIHDSSYPEDLTIERSNAPYGETIHWTKLFDYIILAPAKILMNFMPVRDAIYWSGVFINPFFHLITLLMMIWLSRDLFNQHDSALVGYLFPLQLFTTYHFSVGRPDHHGFMLLMFVTICVCAIRLLKGRNNVFETVFLGLSASMALYGGIESLVIILSVLTVFGLMWICVEGDWALTNARFALFLSAFTVLLLSSSSAGPKFWFPEYDKASVVHALLFSLITIFWYGVAVLERFTDILNSVRKRAFFCVSGGLACILAIYIIFPAFFKGPTVNLDPRVAEIYLSQATEFQSALSFGQHSDYFIILSWLISLCSVVIGIRMIYKTQAEEKVLWFFFSFLLVVYLGLCVYQRRWLSYAQLLCTIPFAFLLHRILLRFNKMPNFFGRALVSGLTISLFCFSPMIMVYAIADSSNTKFRNHYEQIENICRYLNTDEIVGRSSARILTSIYLGPYLLYLTKHEVVGTPAHRNGNGILDTYKVMAAKDAQSAYGVIKRRKIDYVMIGNPEERTVDFFNSKSDAKNTFYNDSWNERLPKWMEPVELPEDLNTHIKIFKVNL